jgi:hypothetical protein
MPNRDKVVVLAEAGWTEGHIETQMQLFLGVLLNKNCRVIILCADPERVLKWVEMTMPSRRQAVFGAFFWCREAGRTSEIKGLAIWNRLSEAIKLAEAASGWQVDRVFLSLADLFMNGLYRSLGRRPRFDYPWVGLYFSPKLARKGPKPLQRLVHRINQGIFLRTEGCQGIGVLDEGAVLHLKRRLTGRKVWTFPDVTDEGLPTTVPDAVKKIREQAGGRTITGLVGLLNRRKGLLSLIKAIEMLDQTKHFFLLAGHFKMNVFSPEDQALLQAFIDKRQENCHIILNYIDDPVAFNSYVNVCDTLFLVYEEFFHSSGILTKAAVFEKPVIVAQGYCMAERTKGYGLGLTVPEGDVQAIMEAITTLSDQQARVEILTKARFKAYKAFHSQETLSHVLGDMLNLNDDHGEEI